MLRCSLTAKAHFGSLLYVADFDFVPPPPPHTHTHLEPGFTFIILKLCPLYRRPPLKQFLKKKVLWPSLEFGTWVWHSGGNSSAVHQSILVYAAFFNSSAVHQSILVYMQHFSIAVLSINQSWFMQHFSIAVLSINQSWFMQHFSIAVLSVNQSWFICSIFQ